MLIKTTVLSIKLFLSIFFVFAEMCLSIIKDENLNLSKKTIFEKLFFDDDVKAL